MVTKIEVCYYAKCSQTDEIWECDDFRTLYNIVLREFRSEMHNTKYYDCRSVCFRYGVVIHEDDFYCRHLSYKDIGFLFVSGCDGRIISCEFERS